MWYISVEQIAKMGDISESVRNYCANERMKNAFLTGKCGLFRQC